MDNVENNMNMEAPEKSGAGAVIGAIIIIVILVLGAIYFWNKEKGTSPDDTATGNGDIENIEQDLEETDIEGLDAEFNQGLNTEL